MHHGVALILWSVHLKDRVAYLPISMETALVLLLQMIQSRLVRRREKSRPRGRVEESNSSKATHPCCITLTCCTYTVHRTVLVLYQTKHSGRLNPPSRHLRKLAIARDCAHKRIRPSSGQMWLAVHVSNRAREISFPNPCGVILLTNRPSLD